MVEEALRKDRDWSAEKRKRRKRGETGERTTGGTKKDSPLPPRHETYTRSPRTCTPIYGKIMTKNAKDETEGREHACGKFRKMCKHGKKYIRRTKSSESQFPPANGEKTRRWIRNMRKS